MREGSRAARAVALGGSLAHDLGDGRVRVRLVQHGWGEGSDWDAGYAYFDVAWAYVMSQLKEVLEADAGQP